MRRRLPSSLVADAENRLVWVSRATGIVSDDGDGQPGWNARGVPASVSTAGLSEQDGDDATGARVTVISNGVRQRVGGGLWEQHGSSIRHVYILGQRLVGVRDVTSGTRTFLHLDHLGSISVATTAQGSVIRQEYDPWGALRVPAVQADHVPITATNRASTGQTRDASGLV